MYLNKHQSIISEDDLSFYEISTRGAKNRSKTGSEVTNNYLTSFTTQTYTIYDFEELEYKPTNLLFDYIYIVDFYKKKKKIIEDEDEEEEDLYENEDPDLYALCDFAMDFRELRERYISQCNMEPKLFTSTFTGSMFQDDKDKK